MIVYVTTYSSISSPFGEAGRGWGRFRGVIGKVGRGYWGR